MKRNPRLRATLRALMLAVLVGIVAMPAAAQQRTAQRQARSATVRPIRALVPVPRLVRFLDLTRGQQRALRRGMQRMRRSGRRDDLWIAAVVLQRELTPRQKRKLVRATMGIDIYLRGIQAGLRRGDDVRNRDWREDELRREFDRTWRQEARGQDGRNRGNRWLSRRQIELVRIHDALLVLADGRFDRRPGRSRP